MPMSPRQRGATLVELLVALPLAALLLALVSAALVAGARTARRVDAETRRAREVRHALGVLEGELRPLAPRALLQVSDTLVAFLGNVAAGVVCAQPAPNAVVLVAPTGGGAPPWHPRPAPGDRVTAWGVAAPDAPPIPVEAILEALVPATPCALVPGAPQPAWRLTLRPGDSLPVSPGLPLHVARPVRYRHYRTEEGWYLGRQRWSLDGWEIIQPVAGPLAAPADGGLRLVAWDSLGTPIAPGPGARHLQVTLRTPAEPIGARTPLPPFALIGGVTLRGGHP